MFSSSSSLLENLESSWKSCQSFLCKREVSTNAHLLEETNSIDCVRFEAKKNKQRTIWFMPDGAFFLRPPQPQTLWIFAYNRKILSPASLCTKVDEINCKKVGSPGRKSAIMRWSIKEMFFFIANGKQCLAQVHCVVVCFGFHASSFGFVVE